MLRDTRLLIVEDEFLIALEIQRVIDDAQAHRTVFARNWSEVAAIGDELEAFDLAIVSPPVSADERATAARLVAAGTAIVVCSALSPTLEGTPLAGAQTVRKPFLDDQLLAACAEALAKRAAR